jgi:hypothetical protein
LQGQTISISQFGNVINSRFDKVDSYIE